MDNWMEALVDDLVARYYQDLAEYEDPDSAEARNEAEADAWNVVVKQAPFRLTRDEEDALYDAFMQRIAEQE